VDLRDIVNRIPEHSAQNRVTTIERGKIVQRSFAELKDAVGEAVTKLQGCGVIQGMRIGIRANNSYAWMVHELALLHLRAISVSFTADFDGTTNEDLCAKYDLGLMLVDVREPGCVSHKVLTFAEASSKAQAMEGAISQDEGFERPGLIFSSGSAGGIKGMVLNRRGIEASVEAFVNAMRPDPNDRLLIFLPMSNFQQRLMYYAALWYGFDLIIVEPKHLFKALQELSPSIVIGPPALYEAIENRVLALPPLTRRLAISLGAAAKFLPTEGLRRMAARAIFAKVHQTLGGNIRFMITGMAPIRLSTLKIFATMGLPLFETYGLIESGSVALNVPGGNRLGSVGKPLPGVRVSLANDNEIIVSRDHPIAVGYFQCAEGENERTFVDGGVATGDIGRFDKDGFLYLVGRKKEIIVTGGGEKIHPAMLEAEIGTCPDIERAVVVPKQSGLGLAAIVCLRNPNDTKAKHRVEEFIENLNGKWRNVSIDSVIFTEEPFSLENNFLRPNLKLDRNRISEHFRSLVG